MNTKVLCCVTEKALTFRKGQIKMTGARMCQKKRKRIAKDQDLDESNTNKNPIKNLIKNLDKMRELIELIDFGDTDPDFRDKSPEAIQQALKEMETEFKQRIEDNRKINGETIPPKLAVFIEKNKRVLAAAKQEMEARGYMDDNQLSPPKLK